MKDWSARLTLACVVLVAVVGPALAAGALCVEGGDDDCCGPDCALCLCCPHAPQPPLVTATAEAPGGTSSGVAAPAVGPAAAPDPRDILHVPKPAPLD